MKRTADSPARTIQVAAAVAVAAAVSGAPVGTDVLLSRSRSRVRDVRHGSAGGRPGRALPAMALAARVAMLQRLGADESEVDAAFLEVRDRLRADGEAASTADVQTLVGRASALLARHASAVNSVRESMAEQALRSEVPRIQVSASLVETIVRHNGRSQRADREHATAARGEVRGQSRSAQIRAGLPQREYRDSPGGAALRAASGAAGAPSAIIMRIPLEELSEDLGGFREKIDRHAFDRTLVEDRAGIVGLWQHNASDVLGRLSNGTMTVRVEPSVFEATATLDLEDPAHVGFVRRVARGDVTGSSFGFRARRDRWEDMPDGSVVRTLLDIELYDVSCVTFPAYLSSGAVARAALAAGRVVPISVRRRQFKLKQLMRRHRLGVGP